ncbi:ABC transporter permease [Acidithiobacillus sp. CV18-2]|uniref:ABC transporter permease n=1 Tax=Igneacidithiobacillus copahuensis TaxID=2724909 RepID=A0AAE3CIK3_9PROT|nr:ABC transporter permease [Igneacidithiobacillus copahuensis]MBU2754087.1 ABC transporter permease [Acidithiobacillus sp. CV18-3]MBU2755839.1 ABC transporter permease [Acidithiobacillus sp. BN09-2]MBU2776567.1 ABC transporter permease [Acidithiobacillus sp. CV18-2]MBU2797743.1 ABC transporter permease [Acidithiobacillus sp. VAN18-2]MBU2798579.1 ABC transporter permease [Acidithiobacillus sp. VAN18-4]
MSSSPTDVNVNNSLVARPIPGMFTRLWTDSLQHWVGQYSHPMTWTGLGLFALLILFSWLGPVLYTASPLTIHANHLLVAPCWQYPFGTDDLGRNMLARMMDGGKATLEVGLLGSVIAMFLGILYGMSAAMSPRWLDKVLMRLLDALLALPGIVLMIFFAAIVPLNTTSLILVLGCLSWPGLARIVRNEALAYKERDYVLAARQFGASSFYVARTHLMRSMLPILIVNATFMVADLILALSGLSFLGLGIQPPHASWGGLLNDGLQLVIVGPWWLIVFPGVAIFLAIVAMNVLGQGLLARLEGR